MDLFKPVYMSTSRRKAKRAKAHISKITDPELLYKITQDAIYDSFKEAAIEKIDDSDILLRIANSPKTMRLADKAIKRMKDNSSLLMTFRNEAINGFLMDYRLMAFIKMEQPLEGEVIHEAEKLLRVIEQFDKEQDNKRMIYYKNLDVRNHAWKCIEKWYAEHINQLDSNENEDKLVQLSQHGNSQIAEAAVKRLPYPGQRDRLVEILMDNKLNQSVRKAAYDKLADNEPEFDSIKICPYCKGINSVAYGYLGLSSDMYFYGYSCELCGHEDGAPEGMGEGKDFSVPYRDYIKNNSLFS